MMKAQDGASNNNTQQLYYFNKFLTNLKPNSSQFGTNIQRKQKKFRSQQNEVIMDEQLTVNKSTYSTTIPSTLSNLSDYTTMYPVTTPFQLTSQLPAINTDDMALVTTPTYYGIENNNNSKSKKDKSIKARRKHVIWGAWHPWSECSRSCGSGVMSQSRDCIR